MRYFIELSYDGTPFVGWQRQPEGDSVQSCLEDAFAILFRKPLSIVGAGRTDAGVHAHQLFAHVDLDEHIDQDLTFRLNKLLPKEIAIRNIVAVTQDAHARFDAISRTYEYHISKNKNAFENDLHYFFKKSLDLELMNQASKIIISHQDFKCFSKSNSDVKTYICNISQAYWKNSTQGYVFTISSSRFLRNMVRAIVGTLVEIGLKKKTLENLEYIIKSRERSLAGYSVPAKGLFLTEVLYPETIFK